MLDKNIKYSFANIANTKYLNQLANVFSESTKPVQKEWVDFLLKF